jgi:mRNA interferase MazF
MEKEFDQWNRYKKEIHEQGFAVLYQQRDLWWCRLGTNIGYEQDGTGKEFERPVLILRGFSKQVCLIVPLTTSQKKNPYHVSVGDIAGKQAFAIVSQLRLVDTKRLFDKIGKLDQEIFSRIQKTIKSFFD